MRLPVLKSCLVLFLICQGCAGAHYPITADSLKYATSLSPVLADSRGKPLYINEDLTPLGNFELTRTSVGFIYSLTGSPIDLSEDLNREVELRKGEGIVDLSLKVTGCFSSFFFPFNILPFYPGCQNVTVTGTVVSRKGDGSAKKKGDP